MKIKNIYKILIFLSTIIFCFSPFFTVLAETSNPILETTSSPLFFHVSPPLWLASNIVSLSKDFNCSLVNLQDCIPNAILSAVNTMLSSTVVAFMTFAEQTLNSAISSDSTFNLGFTPTNNPYISIGWGIVKNLANALLVLGLVAIAISIILAGQESKAKKLLINFIIIALLINFTPVICGFIIDGSNIITSSMMTGGIDSQYSLVIRNLLDTITKDSSLDLAQRFGRSFIVCLFCLFAIVIFFLYAILFYARTIILWVLVIISPLAFATFVIKDLPQSQYIKKIFPSVTFWDSWWESFIQWCVIGIPAGFSLYIADKMLIASQSQASGMGGNFFGVLLAYLLPFLFLIVGFFITISTGSEAAKKLSPEVTSFGKKAVGWAGNTGLGLAAGGVGAAVGAVAVKEGMTRAESAKAGFASGKYTMETEGVAGSAMMAGGKIMGAGIGVAGGVAKAGKNWAIRESGLEQTMKNVDTKNQREELTRLTQRKDLTPEQKAIKETNINERYAEKRGSYGDSATETILKETKKGFKNGAVDAASSLAGGAGGGTIAAAFGAAKEGYKSGKAGGTLDDIKNAMVKGAVSNGATGSDIGRGIADATLGATGRIVVEGIKKGTSEVLKTTASKVTEPHKDKTMTKDEWDEEAKKKS